MWWYGWFSRDLILIGLDAENWFKVVFGKSWNSSALLREILVQISLETVMFQSAENVMKTVLQHECSDARREILVSRHLANGNEFLSLLDPTETQKIEIPTRGYACDHLEVMYPLIIPTVEASSDKVCEKYYFQCFDLKTFLKINQYPAKWKCPMEGCLTRCPPHTLEIDKWIAKNIAQLPRLVYETILLLCQSLCAPSNPQKRLVRSSMVLVLEKLISFNGFSTINLVIKLEFKWLMKTW